LQPVACGERGDLLRTGSHAAIVAVQPHRAERISAWSCAPAQQLRRPAGTARPAGGTRVRLSTCPTADRGPMTDPGPTTQLTRTERLDRLPFTRAHGKLLGASGVGWALDAMDVGLISFIMAALGAEWMLTDAEKSWIGSIGFVGMAIGASVGGLLADRFG